MPHAKCVWCGVEFTFTSFDTYFNYNSLQNMTVTAINLHCYYCGWMGDYIFDK